MADETNPFDEFDQGPAAANPFDEFDAPRETLPATAAALGQVPDEQLPEVTVTGKRPAPESSWSDVLGGLPTSIGARVESKLAGMEEFKGKGEYADARKTYWQSLILPGAVREAKDAGIALTEHPDVVDNAKRLGMRPDVFARDWRKYANMSDEDLQALQKEQLEKIQEGQGQALEGGKRRELAAQTAEAYKPETGSAWSPKSIVFNAATGIPDILAGAAGTVAGGPAGGIAVTMAQLAPEQYSTARNAGADHQTASTYAALSSIAQAVPAELPVVNVLSGGTIGRSVLRKAVGDAVADSAAGKVVGTMATQGASQAVIQTLQEGIDAGLIDQHMDVKDALEHIAQAGLTGAVMGAPFGVAHAAAGRGRKPTVLNEPGMNAAGASGPEPATGSELGTIPETGKDRNIQPAASQPTESPQGAQPRIPEKTQGAGEELGTNTHAALLALQDKTISPAQMEHLEDLGLARRNDVGVPFMLPAGRRALAAPPEEGVSTPVKTPVSTGEKPYQPTGDALVDRIATDDKLRTELERMKSETGWAEVGGRMIRTAGSDESQPDKISRTKWMPNAEWWPERPKGLTEDQTHLAVDKALRGEELGKRERSMVEYMTETADKAFQRPQEEFTQALEGARADTETSPTEAQKKAGNYAKGELQYAPGLKFTMENPKGSTRSGTGPEGPWTREMAHDYGYINRTQGADGDHVDAFLTGKPDTGHAYIVNQNDSTTGKFDEHKVVLGAQSLQEAKDTYRANYPPGWKGLGSIVEMPTERLGDWLQHADLSKPADVATERRESPGKRQAVSQMSPEEMRQTLLTHELTGLPNRRAYDEAPRLSHQVAVDVDSLKWVNDTLGHEHGDALLKATADALSAQTGHAFHISGDEFVVQAHSEEEAHEVMREVGEALKEMPVEARGPDGKVVSLTGLGVSYGVGRNLREADRNLSVHKAAREASGERAARGEKPPGAALRTRREEGLEAEARVAEPEVDRVREDQAEYSSSPVPEAGGDLGVEERTRGPRNVQPASNLQLFTSAETPTASRPITGTHTGLAETGRFSSGIKQVRRWQDAAHIFAPLRKSPQEAMMALVVDAKGRPLAVLRHSLGRTNASVVTTNILAGAIGKIPDAAGVWFGHNHPSGVLEQSQADEQITGRLHELMRGSGIDPLGMVVVVPGGTKASFYSPESGAGGTVTGQTTTASRASKRTAVPVMERRFTSIPAGKKVSLTGPDAAQEAVDNAVAAGHKSGVLLLNNRNELVATLPMDPKEMRPLRTGDTRSGLMHVLRSIEDANASAAITFGEGKDTAALKNLGTMLGSADIHLLDTFIRGTAGEYHSVGGGMASSGSTFYSKRAPETRQSLERQFMGKDDKFWGITPESETRGSEFESGYSGTTCTGYACALLHKLGAARVKVFGFSDAENPASAIARDAGGHDFAVVDGRFIVDPWLDAELSTPMGAQDLPKRGVYDLENPADKQVIAKLYGDRDAWRDMSPQMPTANHRASIEQAVRVAIRDSGARAAPDFPQVQVHADYTSLPRDLRNRVIQDRAENTAGAVYDPETGHIHMIAENLSGPREAQETLWHEAVGHHGLRLIMDADRYANVMDGVWNAMPDRVRQTAERNGLDVSQLTQRRLAAEEVIAYAAGRHLTGGTMDRQVRPLWQRALSAVRSFVARLTGKPFTDDAAIAGLIQESKRALEGGSAAQRLGDVARSQRAETFYSPVERAVTSSKQGKASADQWMATLRKTPGIKPEELEWMGVEPWLKEQKGPVTREQLADYVRANKLELEETRHEGMGEGGTQTELERRQTRLAEELRALGHQVDFDPEGRFDHLGLNMEGEGGEQAAYLMQEPGAVGALRELPDEVRDKVAELHQVSEQVARDRLSQEWDPMAEERGPQYEEFTLPGGENYRELLIRMPEQQDQELYRSQHWSEPNILAHVRTKDRVDADGKKTLFLEELQSDWHQQGRERGYRDKEHTHDIAGQVARAQREYKAAVDALSTAMRNSDIGGNAEDVRARIFGSGLPEEVRAAARASDAARDRLTEVMRENSIAQSTVPQAPFKTSWPMLIMKRMIRAAAEGGYDRIAWTTGEQQAERYGLESHVDRIHWEPGEGARRIVRLVPPDPDQAFGWRSTVDARRIFHFSVDANGMVDQAMTASAHDLVGSGLSDVVGRELAGKIRAEERGDLRGAELKVGGAGQRGFYDDILPRETNRLIRKYGAEVGERRIEAGRTWEDSHGGAASELTPGETMPVHGFDITPEMREQALSQGFPMFWKKPSQQTLGLQQGQGPGWYERVRRAVEYLHDNPMSRDFRKLINPTKLSEESKRTAVLARAALGSLAHQTHETQEHLEQFSRVIDRLAPEEQLEMMDAIEHGVPQPNADLQPVADALRKQLDTWRDRVRGLGTGALDNFIENYFPHYWTQPGQAQRMVATIMGRRPLRGPASFLKMRTIPTIKEGMDAGLTPLTINPLVMTLLKVREMQRFISGTRMMQTFKDAGLAQFLPATKPMPEGWAEIKDNIARVRQWSEEEQGFIERGKYIMPEDAARLINNHVGRSVLTDFTPTHALRIGGNLLNSTQLGWSAFHLGFTTLDASISKNALGIEQLIRGEVGRAAASFAQGMTPAGAIANVARGYRLLKAYADPAGATPEQAKIVSALEAAGGRVAMDRYFMAIQGVNPFRGVGVRSLVTDVREAIRGPTPVSSAAKVIGVFPAEYALRAYREIQGMAQTMPKLQIPFEIAGRVVRASTSWIMEHLVPMQKLGVFSDMASDYLRRNPTATSDQVARAMQSAWDSVDNRLGEMIYDNVFWNRTFKDALHLGIRAVGWNLGTIREIGGAPIDALKLIDKGIREGKVTADDVGHKIPYVLAMTMTTAMLGAAINYMFTGQGPQELKDYFFPRTGGTTNRGTPQRLSLPSYVKDVYEYSQRPGTTITNKLNPIFGVMADIWRNEDYFGNPISEPEAGPLTQAGQRAAYAAREATPFSVQGTQHIEGSDTEGLAGAVKRVLPFIGVSPAPGYVTSPDQLARRERFEAEGKYSRELKYQLTKAMSEHDADKIQSLKEQYIQSQRRLKELNAEVNLDKSKAAKARKQNATSMRQQGYPATGSLIESLPLEPDRAAREYFRSVAGAA